MVYLNFFIFKKQLNNWRCSCKYLRFVNFKPLGYIKLI